VAKNHLFTKSYLTKKEESRSQVMSAEHGSVLISVPDVRERAERRMKAEAKKMKKTHTANLSLTSGAIRP